MTFARLLVVASLVISLVCALPVDLIPRQDEALLETQSDRTEAGDVFCQVGGNEGVCISVDACKATGRVNSAGYCPGTTNIQCCYVASAALPKAAQCMWPNGHFGNCMSQADCGRVGSSQKTPGCSGVCCRRTSNTALGGGTTQQTPPDDNPAEDDKFCRLAGGECIPKSSICLVKLGSDFARCKGSFAGSQCCSHDKIGQKEDTCGFVGGKCIPANTAPKPGKLSACEFGVAPGTCRNYDGVATRDICCKQDPVLEKLGKDDNDDDEENRKNPSIFGDDNGVDTSSLWGDSHKPKTTKVWGDPHVNVKGNGQNGIKLQPKQQPAMKQQPIKIGKPAVGNKPAATNNGKQPIKIGKVVFVDELDSELDTDTDTTNANAGSEDTEEFTPINKPKYVKSKPKPHAVNGKAAPKKPKPGPSQVKNKSKQKPKSWGDPHVNSKSKQQPQQYPGNGVFEHPTGLGSGHSSSSSPSSSSKHQPGNQGSSQGVKQSPGSQHSNGNGGVSKTGPNHGGNGQQQGGSSSSKPGANSMPTLPQQNKNGGSPIIGGKRRPLDPEEMREPLFVDELNTATDNAEAESEAGSDTEDTEELSPTTKKHQKVWGDPHVKNKPNVWGDPHVKNSKPKAWGDPHVKNKSKPKSWGDPHVKKGKQAFVET